MRRASAEMTATIMVGSVRGKHRLEIPFRVAQSGRSVLRGVETVEPIAVGRPARSLGGHVRLVPPLMDRVGCPQPAQNGLRAFQSKSERA